MYSEGEVDSEQRVSFAAKKQLFIQGFVFCFFCVPDIFTLFFRGIGKNARSGLTEPLFIQSFVFCFFAFRTFLTSPVDIPRQRIYNLFMYKTEDFKWIKK